MEPIYSPMALMTTLRNVITNRISSLTCCLDWLQNLSAAQQAIRAGPSV